MTVGSSSRRYQGHLDFYAKKQADKPAYARFEGIADDGVTTNSVYVWADSAGNIRRHTAVPTNQDADGTVLASTTEIANAQIAAAAAIAWSKMAALTSAHILVGSAGNVATDVAVTGDIAITNGGVTSIAAGAIVDADVNAAAAVAFSKLAALPSANILVGSAGNVATAVAMSGDISIDNAGATAIVGGKVTATDFVQFIGAQQLLKDSANLALTRGTLGVWYLARTAAGAETYHIAAHIPVAIRTSASRGLKLSGITLIYEVGVADLTSGTLDIKTVTHASASAPVVANHADWVQYALAGADLTFVGGAPAGEKVIAKTIVTPAYQVTDLVALIAELEIVMQNLGTIKIRGFEAKYTYTTL